MAAKKIALFIDADNISAKFGKQIIDTLESRGEIFIRRIYGNWEKISLHGWNECILNFSLRAVQQPDFAAGKNATDMSLTIDAMDVLYGGHAEIFALVSNDSDFTPLVIRLREGGMNVIGMGNEKASLSFRNACNEFIDLDKTIEPPKVVTPPKPPPPTPKIEPLTPPPAKVSKKDQRQVQSQRDKAEHNKRLQQMHSILQETAKAYSDADGFVYLNRAIAAFAKKNYGFEPKNVGYTSWQKFISAFPRLYALKGTGTIFYYRCLTVEQKSSGDKLQAIHDILREAAKAHGDAKGFFLLNMAGMEIKNKNLGLGVKDFGYGTLQEFMAAFPKLYEVKKSGNFVYYRCLTAEQKSSGDKRQAIHEILREVATTHKDLNDGGGFTDLTRAGQKAHEKNLSIKALGYSSWSKFVSDFPKLYEVKKVGTIVYYRCR